jgi:hypothetical protein
VYLDRFLMWEFKCPSVIYIAIFTPDLNPYKQIKGVFTPTQEQPGDQPGSSPTTGNLKIFDQSQTAPVDTQGQLVVTLPPGTPPMTATLKPGMPAIFTAVLLMMIF